VGDEFVTSDTGTGFVHIAPGHGMEDYLLGLRVGLPIYSPVNDDGCFTHTGDLPVAQQMPAEMVGKSILEKHGKSDANEAVLHELRVRGALLHQENYHHSYPHCWRSKTPIIFRAMDQWFIKIDHVRGNAGVSPASFGVPPNESPQQSSTRDASNSRPEAGAPQAFRQVALDEINRVRWIPDWGKGRIEAAVKGRPDWCISRQRSWGVPIPFFYDSQGNPLPDPAKEPELSAQVVRKAADLIEQQSSNVWFEKSAAELWAHCKPSGWTGPEAVAKSNDTLDVWIDSGSSSRAVLMRRSELHHATGGPGSTPAPSNQGASGTAPSQDWVSDIYLEGSDQHRGWFQSSLLLSLAGNGAAPFKTVLTHGFMVDEDRQKVSKSKQGQAVYEKPQTADRYVQEFGADVLRLWVASQDYRSDIVVSEERIKKVGETYRVIRNALRYQLSNLYDFDPAKHTVPDDQLTGLDRWILGEFAKLEADVAAAYDAYEFHVVYQKISQFAAVELSAIYHDVVKDRLYTDAANSARRRSTQTALHRMVTSLCQMLAPILAFTTEEAWEFVPGKSAENVHAAVWKPMSFTVSEAERQCWAAWMRLRELAFAPIEAERKKGVIGKNLESKIQIWGSWDSLAVGAQHRSELQELLNVSQLTVELTPALDGEVKIQYQVIKASGQKCERCWHWETNVGTHAEHPTLCARCVEAVKENSGA
jgi:isoleucyl-tRNA synthetase